MKFITAQVKGQTLVIILLGTSVALTVALAVSVRTISTLKQTTTSAQAQEALAAAEAGVEVALNNIKNGAACILGTEANCYTPADVALPNGTFYSFVARRTGGGTDPNLLDLAKDQTQEVKLTCGGAAGCTDYPTGSIRIYWYDPDLDGSTEPQNAIEIIYIYKNGGVTGMAKYGYNGITISPSNGFAMSPNNGSYLVSVGGKQVRFNHYVDVSLTNTPQVLRLKAFYSNFSAAVAPLGAAMLPPQGYVVNSTGRTADSAVKKAIRVSKSLPALPHVFDYSLYNGSMTQPLSK
jgi:hypothetical protein